MTNHRDVNKCRQKEKCKMVALIRQANCGYEMANKPKIKKEEEKKEECMVEEKGKKQAF